jgi:hypothetical protein
VSDALTFPEVHFIEAKVGPSIVTLAAGPLPNVPIPIGILYTVAFDGDPDLPAVIKAITAAFKEAGVKDADFWLSGGPLLTVEPEFEPAPADTYKGLRTLQELFKPRIPRTALVYETDIARKWDIQMSILGGFLPQDEIAALIAAIETSGATVRQVVKSEKQQADVFFITVPVPSAHRRRGFIHGLQKSCGIFATVQDQS